ncbi:MAG: helix-turn-helix transcriptional regulator [Parvularcula sp.]
MMRLVGIGVFVFSLLIGMIFFEYSVDPDPFRWGDFAVDLAEKMLLLATMLGAAFLAVDVRRMREDQSALRQSMEADRSLGEAWRKQQESPLAELADAINGQLGAWGLTPAEQDVAQLMLKGMSHKEVALARKTSEATVRQQAASIYRKAGLKSRRELSAYFLDDMFDKEFAKQAVPAE